MGVLVLDDAPGEAARVEEARVEPDLARDGVRARRRLPMWIDDLAGDEAPVEAARVEGCGHLAALCARAAVEDVAAAGRLRRRRQRQSKKEREEKTLEHVL